MTLLSPEVADRAPAGEWEVAGPTTAPAGLPAHPVEDGSRALLPAGRTGAALAAARRQVVLIATIVWLAGRLAALATARLIDWFAAEPHRPRAAGAGLAIAVAVGTVLGAGVGFAVDGCWSVVRGLVLDNAG
jgi:hypothetical protein